jgi:hypothetical protein
VAKTSIKNAEGQEQKSIFLKNFYSFSHIELRESGIKNQEPFSPQSRIFALLIRGRYYLKYYEKKQKFI